LVKKRTVSHDAALSPGDNEIKKNSVASVASVAKINFMAAQSGTTGPSTKMPLDISTITVTFDYFPLDKFIPI
jgi:hypothetical protein